MILFQNNVLKLDYNPATDILEVDYPNLHDFLLPEIKHSITIMIEYIKNYDIKRLLLDSSKTTFIVNTQESRDIAICLATELIRTRIQRVARLQSLSAEVEISAQENIRHISQASLLPFQLQNFATKAEAIGWLKESNTI